MGCERNKVPMADCWQATHAHNRVGGKHSRGESEGTVGTLETRARVTGRFWRAAGGMHNNRHAQEKEACIQRVERHTCSEK